ncbi:MAG: hypothetical protein WDO74_30765 [Pseudomonadota bacterium]
MNCLVTPARSCAKIDPDYLVDNPERRCPIISKARAELGYAPAVLVDEGLRRSMIWVLGQSGGRGIVSRISVLGVGYVGLVTGVCFADKGART